jgi:putative DNA primase/helicase
MDNESISYLVEGLIQKHAIAPLKNGYQYVTYHTYMDEHNQIVYIKIRLKHKNGKKWIRPFHVNTETQNWVMSEPKFIDGKPLYRLPILTSNLKDIIWLHEGELCVELMEQYGFLCTTSGSSSSVSTTNWLPMANRTVYIWPDNSPSGTKYLKEATQKLLSLGCIVKAIDIGQLDLPHEGDVVDWLDREKLRSDHRTIVEKINSLPLITLDSTLQNNLSGKSYIRYRNAATITVRPIEWLWINRFACGKISMISGNPGLGKSQIIVSMAAIITRGALWPDGTSCQAGSVLFLSAEDDAADTLIPRLIAANADLTRVDIIDTLVEINNGAELEGQVNLSTNIASLEKLLLEIKNVAVIFIDPITAYLGDTNDHRNAGVRAVFGPLAKLAEKYNIAIICVSHNNKNGAQEALFRVIGSIGFVAASRAAFAVIKDPDNEGRRLFLPLKNNIGNDKTGLAFTIESCVIHDEINTSCIRWSDECITTTADEAMVSSSRNMGKHSDEATTFLSEMITTEFYPVVELFELAKKNGISEKMLRKAKEKLNISHTRSGFGKDSKVYWHTKPLGEVASSINSHTFLTKAGNL